MVVSEQLDRNVELIHRPAYAEVNEGLWLGQDEAGLVRIGECPSGLAPAMRAAQLAGSEFRVK